MNRRLSRRRLSRSQHADQRATQWLGAALHALWLNDVITIRVRPFQHWLPQLLRAVAAIGDVAPEQIASPRCTKRFVTLRQAYVLAARDRFGKSFEEIGRSLGRSDHTSSRCSYLKARERMGEDREFQQLAQLACDVANVIAGSPRPTIEIEPELPL